MFKIFQKNKKVKQSDQPCRRHYWAGESFKDCPICGWSATVTAYEDLTPKEQKIFDQESLIRI